MVTARPTNSFASQALYYMIDFNIPISKMIQWIAAKRIKEINIDIDDDELFKYKFNYLDPDVQDYLNS